MGGGVLALDLARQPRQAVKQHRLGIAVGDTDGLGQLRQFKLGTDQGCTGITRSGQAKQSSHTVRFDFQQLLDDPTQALGRKCLGHEQHAREAIGMDGKVGIDLTLVIRDDGSDERFLAQPTA